jgi:probable HAF family extracellular repeat protein
MRSITSFALVPLLLTLAACSDTPAVVPPALDETTATEAAARATGETLYEIEHLGSLGGMSSRGNVIDPRGRVAGHSNLAGVPIRRAALWQGSTPLDLGTLGGEQSSVTSAGLNPRGMVVGISETAQLDPEGQAWSCAAFFEGSPSGRICRGFVWEDGEMTELPTLGGPNGFAQAVNARGQVVGWAETDQPDPTCIPERVFGFLAVVWEPSKGRAEPLPPLPGHSASAATAINDRGQVVGISGDCDQAVGRFSARSGVLWDRGRVIEIGGLGGISWNTPWAINNRGDVVGFANPPGDELGGFNGRAFFWTERGGIHDLGTLEGDTNSQANSINVRRQVVGTSFGGPAGQRAFIWQDGDDELTDLNDLAVPGYDGVLVDARYITADGRITGSARDADSGDLVTFVATPVQGVGRTKR